MSAVKARRGERLAQARHEAGLSQQALGDKLGSPRSTIARIETGVTTPSLDMAFALSRVLGKSVDALFGGEER
jgi:putative transcriptional regulator